MPRKRRVVSAPPIEAGDKDPSGISSGKKPRKSPRARAEERQIEEAIRMSLSRTLAPTEKHLEEAEVLSLIEDPVHVTGSLGSRSTSPGIFHGFESPSEAGAKTPPEKCFQAKIELDDDPFPATKYRSQFEEALSELESVANSGLDGQLDLQDDSFQGNETILSIQGVMSDPKVPLDEFFSSPKPEVIEEKSNCAKLVEEAINNYEEYRKIYLNTGDASSSVSSYRSSEESYLVAEDAVNFSEGDEECEGEEVTFLHCNSYSTSCEEYDYSEEEEGDWESDDEVEDTRLTPTNYPELMLKSPTSVYQCEICDKTYKGWNDTIRDHMIKIHFSKISLTEEESRYYLTDVEKFVVRKPVLFYDKKRVIM